MENNKKLDWEKIGVYFASLSLVIALFSFMIAQQLEISNSRERIARLEIKLEYIKPDAK